MVVSGSHRACGGPACSSALTQSPPDTSSDCWIGAALADMSGVSMPLSADRKKVRT